MRSDVVPIQTMRPPASRAALRAVAVTLSHMPPFSVHDVVSRVCGLYWKEGATADVERDPVDGGACGFDLRQKFGGKMKSGRWARRRHPLYLRKTV